MRVMTDVAHPIPMTSTLIFGISFALILLFLVLYRKTPISIWSLWTLVALVPFLSKSPISWRYLYFASAGSAFVLAYFIFFLDRSFQKNIRPLAYTTGTVILVILIYQAFLPQKS